MYENVDLHHAMHDPYSTALQPRTILLRDGETVSTMYPIPASPELLPAGLLDFLLDEFNMEIENGQSFPFYEPLNLEEFKKIWFDQHGVLCIMVLGELPELDYSVSTYSAQEMDEPLGLKYSERSTSGYLKRKERRNLNLNIQWERQCLGMFNLKPAHPGRSSHVATGAFLVNAGIRGKGIGKTLVESFLHWAPQLGFTSCYFPLVYGTNVGIRRIFESSNLRRIGKLPESGILKGFDSPVDSFIYGKEFTHVSKHMSSLQPTVDDTIKAKYERLIYYLEHREYPPSCTRNEKARLRVIAKKHSLINGKLYFKGKEVVYDPEKQVRIAYETHMADHQGINRITSKLAEKYHWKGIKQTVIQVINSCSNCQDGINKGTEDGVVIDTRTDPNGQPHTIVHAIPHDNLSASLERLEEMAPTHPSNKSRLKTSFVQRIKFDKGTGASNVKRKIISNENESMNSFPEYDQEYRLGSKKRMKGNEQNGEGPGTVILEEETPNSMVDDALLNLDHNVMAAVEAVEQERNKNISKVRNANDTPTSFPHTKNSLQSDQDGNRSQKDHSKNSIDQRYY